MTTGLQKEDKKGVVMVFDPIIIKLMTVIEDCETTVRTGQEGMCERERRCVNGKG